MNYWTELEIERRHRDELRAMQDEAQKEAMNKATAALCWPKELRSHTPRAFHAEKGISLDAARNAVTETGGRSIEAIATLFRASASNRAEERRIQSPPPGAFDSDRPPTDYEIALMLRRIG